MRTELEMEQIINKYRALDRKREIWHLKNDRVYNHIFNREERAKYSVDLGKQYMEYRKPQPSYPTLSLQGLLSTFKKII